MYKRQVVKPGRPKGQPGPNSGAARVNLQGSVVFRASPLLGGYTRGPLALRLVWACGVSTDAPRYSFCWRVCRGIKKKKIAAAAAPSSEPVDLVMCKRFACPWRVTVDETEASVSKQWLTKHTRREERDGDTEDTHREWQDTNNGRQHIHGEREGIVEHRSLKTVPRLSRPVSYTHLTLPTICSV